ncbi:MAG: hypothetical protein IPH62_15245 [Ignavibacteriae bacterium]|nr:hypothetical protein [Ignavibacteriota bacterium]
MDAQNISAALTEIQKHFRVIKLYAEELEFYSNNFYLNSKYRPASKIVEIAEKILMKLM